VTDIRTVFIDFDRGADLALEQFALAADDGLETAIILSLFTDARASNDDPLPFGESDRRGWWADAFPEVDRDRIGSRLWLLQREKQTQATLNRAREYAEEALAWLIADGVARSVEVASFLVRNGVLGLSVVIQRPDASIARFRYETLWKR